MADNSAPALTGSTRRIPKATYVSIKLNERNPENGAGILKFGFISRLGLQPGEVALAGRTLKEAGNPRGLQRMLRTLTAFEGSPIPSQLPAPSVLASFPTSSVRAFGRAVVNARQKTLGQLGPQATDAGSPADAYAMALHRYNNARTSLNVFENNIAVSPIGMLNLERLAMTPVGVQRGELLATIPLAPLEQTAVEHKEWSVTSKEFSSIVTDSLENYSETGVTENTELAQSVTSQTTHNHQFSVNATVSGGYGPVTATVSTGFSAQDQMSASANESRKHAISTTRKASARVKQEHKVTIITTTQTGTSETSTRVMQNPSQTNAMRIDYFSIMRKWHVGLYRYGLRMTYDIAIPEPGATLRRLYAELADLKSKIGPFRFTVKHDDIRVDDTHYLDLAEQFGAAQLPPPPPGPLPPLTPSKSVGQEEGWDFFQVEFSVPSDYQVSNVHLYADMGPMGGHGGVTFVVEGTSPLFVRQFNGPAGSIDEDLPGFLQGAVGPQIVNFNAAHAGQALAELKVSIEPTDEAKQHWINDVWSALFNAAQAQYYAEQQDIAAQIAALEDQISNIDTLTLRREENEEIMKGVLRWLLGPTFDFMPADVLQMFENSPGIDLVHGAAADGGDGLAVSAQSWAPTIMFGEMVKFINEAIEWENVLYFLYSYFWDVPPSWDFIRQIRHPDATRQAFLRAGSARVVLPVRKGWEEAWVNFVEAGGFGQNAIPNHPYISVAKEIQLYDQTNYPGIPPANPAGGPLPDDGESVATASSDSVAASGQPVTIRVNSSAGFIVGYTAILGSWDDKDPNDPSSTLQENQTILAVDTTKNTITVERVDNRHDGSTKPFVIMQAGEKGQLIAEWFEYTPTSGTDIAVTSNLTTIA